MSDAIEPTALGEITHGDFGLREGLDGLSGHLYVAHDVELVDFVEADLLADGLFLFDLEDFTRFADAEALRVDIGSAEFVAWGDEAADLRTRRLLGETGWVEEGELGI